MTSTTSSVGQTVSLVLPGDPSEGRSRAWLSDGVVAVGGGLLLGLLLAQVGTRAGAGAVAGLVLLVVLLLATPWASRRSDLVALALVAAVPVGPLSLGPVEVVQGVSVMAALAVLVPAAMRGGIRLPTWPVLAPLLAFVLVAVASSTASPDPGLAVRLTVQLIVLVTMTVALTTALTTVETLHRAVTWLAVAGGVTAAWALLTAGPTATYYGGSVVSGRAEGLFSQPNELGLVCAVLLVVAVGIGLTRRGRGIRLVCLLSAALLLAALGLSLSRGAWLGAGVGLLALAVTSRPVRRPLVVAATSIATVVVVMAVLGVGFAPEVLARIGSIGGGAANPYDQRPLIYDQAARLATDHPVLGVGPGGFTSSAAGSALRDGSYLEVEHAHNLFLNALAEFGFVGAAALVALITGLAVCGARTRRTLASHEATSTRSVGQAQLPAILVAALVAVLGHTLVDYPLRNATCITVVWLVLSLLAAADRVAADRTRAPDAHAIPTRR